MIGINVSIVQRFMARVVASRLLAAALAAAWLGAMYAPVSANAAKPLEITQLSLTPIENTIETISGGSYEFTNVPYKTPFTQAGGHPWGLTAATSFSTEELETDEKTRTTTPTADAKDVITTLPPGLLGDPMAVPQCPLGLVTGTSNQCPGDTQIGYYVTRLEGGHELLGPIVNVTPEAGQSAEFALENTIKIQTPLLTAHLTHGPEGYGFTVSGKDVPALGIESYEVTFWGVPADHSHDALRGLFCRRPDKNAILACEGGGERSGLATHPFLTLTTDCSAGPETATVRVDSWESPGSVREGAYSGFAEATTAMQASTGCDLLHFDPSIEVRPDTVLADEPVGLNVAVKVPLNETSNSAATPQLKDTSVTLPEGMSVSPSVVDGIQACNEFGPEGINITGPESEEIGLSGELQLAPGHCPDASTVGTAEAITPFLPIPIKGHVYLARPGCGGVGQRSCTNADVANGTLYRLYLELGGTGELAQTGIHFKVPLETHANPVTGQLTTTTLGTPQAPFSELRIHLNGGPRAPIANPAACGPAVTRADFTPWSAPGITAAGQLVPGTPDATSQSYFTVQGCNPGGLAPTLIAGTVSAQAATFTPFTMSLLRNDRDQYVRTVQVHTPPGLLGMLSNVPLCSEAAANDGTCSEMSRIGTTRVASGAGSHPFEIEGEVYLTEKYGNAPFGLSVVTHVVAGPFNLGIVVVRARIDIDRHSSTLTVTTDETGPHAIPQVVFGVPLRLKRVTVNIDRPNFMFNPTNCHAQHVVATVAGAQGALATVSVPFASSDCRRLVFKPKFVAATSGRTSRRRGASLDARLSYPKGSFGKEVNIGRVKVSLPRELPSRLTTLQKACPAETFEANPASCPTASVVGIARASTPVLPVNLSGPVYFVSHGGEAFPSLVIVLQGDGVRVDLVGTTFISKRGITSSTFKTVPDVPVNTFELYLPEGSDSALAANGNLCKHRNRLTMPTEMVAQDGAVFRQTTKIAVSGCKARRKRK
jgi:hypothetical protein